MKASFFRAGSLSMLTTLSGQAFAVLHFALSARGLSLDALGAWSLFLTLVSFIDMARLGLIQNALGHYLAHSDADEQPALHTAALVWSAVVQTSGAVILLLVSNLPAVAARFPELPGIAAVYPLMAVVISVMKFYEHAAMARQEFRATIKAAIAYGACANVLLAVFLAARYPLHPADIVWLQIPAALFGAAIAALAQRRSVVLGRVYKKWLLQLGAYGRYGAASGVTSMLMQRADMLLLSALVAPAQLALYGVATRVIAWIDLPLGAWGLAVFPRLAQVHREQGAEGAAAEYDRAVGTLAALTAPMGIGAALFAAPIVWVLGGPEAGEAALLVQIMALGGLVKPWGRMAGVLFDASGRPKINFLLVLFTCAVNVVLVFIFAGRWGSTGAALAGAATVLITVFIGQMTLRRHFPVFLTRSFAAAFQTYSRIWHKFSRRGSGLPGFTRF